jgi:hypothetical protein
MPSIPMTVFARTSWLQKMRPLLAPSLLSRKHNLFFFLSEIKEIKRKIAASVIKAIRRTQAIVIIGE